MACRTVFLGPQRSAAASRVIVAASNSPKAAFRFWARIFFLRRWGRRLFWTLFSARVAEAATRVEVPVALRVTDS